MKRNNRKDAERWEEWDNDVLDGLIFRKGRPTFGVYPLGEKSRVKYYEERDAWMGKYVFGH